MQMEPTEAYEVLCYVPARSLPYNQPGTCYTLVALPKEDPTAGEPPRPPRSPWVGVGRAACAPAVRLWSELQLLEVCPEQKAGPTWGFAHSSSFPPHTPLRAALFSLSERATEMG